MGKFLSTGKGVVITVALALLVAFWAGLLLVTNRAASRAPVVASAPETPPRARTIVYRTVESWAIPGGGIGRVIVIEPRSVTETELRTLGDQLRYEARGGGISMVIVYDDASAATMRKAAMADRLSSSDLRYHDRHMVGTYNRNSRTGFDRWVYYVHGVNGPEKMVDY